MKKKMICIGSQVFRVDKINDTGDVVSVKCGNRLPYAPIRFLVYWHKTKLTTWVPAKKIRALV